MDGMLGDADTAHLQPPQWLTRRYGPLRCTAVDATGRLAILASNHRLLCLEIAERPAGSANADRPAHALLDSHRPISAVAVGARRIVIGMEDGALIVNDCETGEPVATLEGHTSSINSLVLLDDDRVVLSASDDGTLRMWTPDCPMTCEHRPTTRDRCKRSRLPRAGTPSAPRRTFVN